MFEMLWSVVMYTVGTAMGFLWGWKVREALSAYKSEAGEG